MRRTAAARYCLTFLSTSRASAAAFSSPYTYQYPSPHFATAMAPSATTSRRRTPRLQSSEQPTKRKHSTSTSVSAKSSVVAAAASSADEAASPLLDLGTLVEGVLIKRPSATIRSPYVADCQLADSEPDAPFALAHAPALDVGGLCAPNSTVLMKERPPGGKTSHSIELVIAAGPNGDDDEDVLVGAHPQLGEKLAEEVLRRGLLSDETGFEAATETLPSSPKKKKKKAAAKSSPKKGKADDGDDVEKLAPGTYLKKQVTYGDSRVDFELTVVEEGACSTTKALIEVKNIVCSDYFGGNAPEKKNDNHCVIISPEETEAKYKRTAIFPWGRLGQEFEGRKVVSERAIKHIRNLVDVGKRFATVQPIICFVVNRSDCESVRACHEQCPVFAEELTKAKKNGVKIVAFRVKWSKDGKAYFDGVLPVDA